MNGVTDNYAESIASVLKGKKAYEYIAYPKDKVEKGGQNEFEIKFAIFDDSSDNVALAEPMKDLGTITVTFGNDN